MERETERADGLIVPAHGRGLMAHPFNSETGRAGGRAGKGKPKKLSLTGAIRRELRKLAKDGSGERNVNKVAQALVMACERGDVGAIKLALDRIDGPQTQKRETTHRTRLLVQPVGDARGLRRVELEQAVPTLTQGATSDNGQYDAQDATTGQQALDDDGDVTQTPATGPQ